MITQHEYQVRWPEGRPRTAQRKNGQFQVNLATAAERIEVAVDAFTKRGHTCRTKSLTIFADVPASSIGARGRFLANAKPFSPEVAVSFDLDGKEYHICADAFTDAAQNLAGIAEYIKAIRAQERNGIFTAAQMMGSFAALPAGKDWREVLGHPKTLEEARAKHRALMMENHPDRGGDPTKAAEINAAFDQAKAEFEEADRG